MEITSHTNPNSASDLLRADHRKIETHLDRMIRGLKNLTADQVGCIQQAFVAIQQLSTLHFEQEERVLYPEIRPKIPDMLAKMDREHEDVRETERCLAELLASMPPIPVQRDMDELHRLGIEFHDAVQVHIVDEEEELLKTADRLLSA